MERCRYKLISANMTEKLFVEIPTNVLYHDSQNPDPSHNTHCLRSFGSKHFWPDQCLLTFHTTFSNDMTHGSPYKFYIMSYKIQHGSVDFLCIK